jgi:hypothetical protein
LDDAIAKGAVLRDQDHIIALAIKHNTPSRNDRSRNSLFRGGSSDEWKRLVNRERSVIASLELDWGQQRDNESQDHPNRGEHYAGGRIGEFCAYCMRSLDRPIEGTV